MSIYSSDKQLAGIWKAMVIEYSDAGIRLYIPALHRDQLPFQPTGSPKPPLLITDSAGHFILPNGYKTAMTQSDYPLAQSCCWEVRTPLEVGDAVYVMFENGDANYPVVMGNLGKTVELLQNATASAGASSSGGNSSSSGGSGVAGVGDYVDIPEGIGTYETFMGYHLTTNTSAPETQLKLKARNEGRYEATSMYGMANCATIDGRLCIATVSNIGNKLPVAIGDYVDVSFSDGTVWNCIIAETKSQTVTWYDSNPANEWGHDNGKVVVEIVYHDYSQTRVNQYKKVTRITKVGSYSTGVNSNAYASSSLSSSNSSSGVGAEALQFAMTKLGCPYSWGGTGPSSFDCSGLVYWAFAQAGKSIPRTSYEQYSAGVSIDKNNLQAGDVVFFKGSDGTMTKPGHVGIYAGNSQYIHAPQTGDVVKLSNLSSRSDYIGAKRIS